MIRKALPSPLLVLLAAPVLALAAPLDYNDIVSPDLSGDGSAPTSLVFDLGVNFVGGRMGRDEPADPIDADIFTFTLPVGLELTSINVLLYSAPDASFFAIAGGPTISTTDSAAHLSNRLVNTSGEILDDLDFGSYNGGLGLVAPLGPGTYTVWFQEASTLVDYRIAYTVSAAAIPEPASVAALAGMASLGSLMVRRRPRG